MVALGDCSVPEEADADALPEPPAEVGEELAPVAEPTRELIRLCGMLAPAALQRETAVSMVAVVFEHVLVFL